MQPDTVLRQRISTHPGSLYTELKAQAIGLPNDELFAQIISAQQEGKGALPPSLGLTKDDFLNLLSRHFKSIQVLDYIDKNELISRELEREDVRALLLENRAGKCESERWMAEIVSAACLANDHLWQDLGLRSRSYLSQLMTQNFPALAAKNEHDMKWKKFLYKQLCEREGVNACRAPSCEYCVDYLTCFGPEE
jgi:nitrogen fixation protein NifQ